MATVQTLTRRFERVFEPEQAVVLAESITEAYSDLVKTSDFNELKAIVRELAEAQKRTEARINELTKAQLRTESRVDDLGKDMQQLTRVVTGMAQEMGGLARSMSYSLENEAYRALPAFLQEQHGITLTDRIVRTDIAGEEINFFALGTRNSEPICLVGESKLQLDERRNNRREAERVVDQLAAKVDAVRTVYPDHTIVRLLVTHYARPSILRLLQAHDILVVQTFEW
jgi:RNA polymerase-interacting CarD/CdnL/TRCF family regulator